MTPTPTCWPPRRGRRAPRCSGWVWSSDDPERVRELINDQLVRADLILTTGGVSQGDYDVVKSVMPELGATEFVAGRHAAGQAAGLRPDRRRPGPDDHAAGQPGERVRVLRGVRASGDQEADGSHALHPGAGQGSGHARDELDLGRRQLARGIITHDDDGDRLV